MIVLALCVFWYVLTPNFNVATLPALAGLEVVNFLMDVLRAV